MTRAYRSVLCVFAAVLMCLVSNDCHAAGDWVTLRDGTQIHGRIIRQSDKELVLQSKNVGKLSFKLNQIKSIHYSEASKSASDASSGNRRTKLAVQSEKGLRHEPAKDRLLVEMKLLLPRDFREVKKDRRSSNNRTLGQFEDHFTHATVRVRQYRNAQQGDSFMKWASEKRSQITKTKAKKLQWRTRLLDNRESIYSVWQREAHAGAVNNKSLITLLLWINSDNRKIYEVEIKLSMSEYKGNKERYEAIFDSLKLAKARASKKTEE